ncbi:hypothetical protein AXF14_11480 [Actinomyces radicidentis]|uniref:DUF3710 domain-containing protein n=1 Tax=Actinomyces radicidentis TaxID=111015 RepID=A0A0X8JFW8_ACTRD|nr:DUF3710 domain-containing protein [Actinomyces radicidentis]AMD88080.1 hypothetical protein AXF14_11480 [Actinomyces radicidentis]
MGLFSRRKKAEATDDATTTEAIEAETTTASDDAATSDAVEEGGAEPPTEPTGPWDLAEAPAPDSKRLIDLGSVRVPGVDGMQLRLENARPGVEVGAVVLVLEGSTLELRAFAAPRTAGVWEELRADIVAELKRAKAEPSVVEGEHGPEVAARVPVQTPDGQQQRVPVRFLGVDGPRWFLRGVLQGPAAVDDEASRTPRDVFNGVVVVRDGQARPPREILPLHAPGSVTGPDAEDLRGLEPLEPGPTIAEVR